jgi:putative flavoprotein involved in K+ transport
VGAGHGGLAVARDLVRAGREVLVVDAHQRVGDAWRTRWDSLRLFTPRDLDGLPGIPFPRGDDAFPTKDEVAGYQERYAQEMRLPLRLGGEVRALKSIGDTFEATVGGNLIRARSVVIAGGAFNTPRIPDFASRLDPTVLQLHSRDYRRARDLPEGPVVVVGAANSGSEIAVEVARERPTTIAIGTRKPLAPKRFRSPTWWKLALLRRGRFAPAATWEPISMLLRPRTDSGSRRASLTQPPTGSASLIAVTCPRARSFGPLGTARITPGSKLRRSTA